MPSSPPPSRSERQERTRDALVVAAQRAFARDGFHGANLTAIAAEAGFTKGAIYSNFESKAELFLAVLDRDIDEAFAADADMLDRGAWGQALDPDDERADRHAGQVVASLEFIATALRDPDLAAQLAQRTERIRRRFVELAAEHRSEDDPLDAEQLGTLLLALQQGTGLLLGLGVPSLTGEGVEAAMERIVAPGTRCEDPSTAPG